jgi:D-alanyl-D-alanine carboxypeptidase
MRIFGGFGRAVCALAMFGAATISGRPASANPVLVFEPGTGMVLYAEQPDRVWYPASLTKLMTAYLTFEAVKTGKLTWQTKIVFSDKARGQPETRIGLRKGIDVTVDQAVRGLILRSANDFAVALAETIGGSEEGFAEQMNATAKRLNMTRSHFVNPHGLPDPAHVSTARDMALLTTALLKDFPDESAIFGSDSVVIHRGTFHSQNDLLRTVAGGDGMKTGFTCGAGYNVVASATRDGRRIAVVVLGERGRLQRSTLAVRLIEEGFAPPVGADGTPVTKPVALTALALDPPEANTPPELYRETRLRTCGPPDRPGRVPRPLVAKVSPNTANPAAIQATSSATIAEPLPPRKPRIAKPAAIAATGPIPAAASAPAAERVPLRKPRTETVQAGMGLMPFVAKPPTVAARPKTAAPTPQGTAVTAKPTPASAGATITEARVPVRKPKTDAVQTNMGLTPLVAKQPTPPARPKVAVSRTPAPQGGEATNPVKIAKPLPKKPPVNDAARPEPARKPVQSSDYGNWTRASTPP